MHVSLLDVYQPRETLVHRLDARIKTLASLLFIFCAVTLPEGAWLAYALLFGFLSLISWMAKIDQGFTIRRSLIALPFMLAALPLPFLTPGETIFILPGIGWTISDAGVIRFLSVLLRTWIAVQAGILLSATTPVPDLLWGLSRLRVPRIIVATVGLMVRYLFVLADEVLRMMRARAARSPKLEGVRGPGMFWQGRTTGMMVGSLFLSSLERSERVYAAMLARGYDGQPRRFQPSKLDMLNWTAFGIVLLMLAGILALGVWS